MAYPGRVVIIGKTPSGNLPFVVYCITGRSPSSQARRIVFEEARAVVRPTDDELLETGDPELLLYPAIMISQGIAVSNGRQTSSIRRASSNMEAAATASRITSSFPFCPAGQK
jgi:IMP cyclohydrolase